MSDLRTNKKYWDTRKVRRSKLQILYRTISKMPYFFSSLFFSINLGTELWITKCLRKKNIKSCLDIGCGAGFRFAKYIDCKFYGVDIPTAPLDECKFSNDYTEAKAYLDEYEIPYDQQFDCGICVNLNAHVSDEIFVSLLKKAFKKIKTGQSIFVVLELDNDGYVYKKFKNYDKNRFELFVHNMHHDNLRYFDYIEDILIKNGFYIKLIDPIVGPFIPSSHLYAYFNKNNSSKILDLIFSVLNYFLRNKKNSYLLGVELCYAAKPDAFV